MKEKLTTMERRAKEWCEGVKRSGSIGFTVEWSRSNTWGLCPRMVNWRGDKLSHASGCGYCKLSAVLAAALCFMADNDTDRSRIGSTSGAGESSVMAALAAIGWELKKTSSSKYTDSYILSRSEERKAAS